MGDYDAASVVGQMAGLGANEPKPEPITPEQLIARFTNSERRDDEKRCTIYTGFCGYNGGRGDSMVVGFDDGYDFMGYLSDRGWVAGADKGDWPYVVYLAYRPDGVWAIVEYCECDFALWLFDDSAAAQAFYKTLRDAP